MFKKNKVFFKGKGSGLIIVLDKSSSYEELKHELLNKVKKSKTFFEGASEDIVFEGKELTDEQEKEIADIIISNSGLGISSFSSSDATDAQNDEQNDYTQDASKEERLSSHEAAYVYDYSREAIPLADDEKVLIYNGFVRSGTLVEADGNIVIIGGVNPGGEVFAGKNIIVFGQLKGKAIAGRGGDPSCIIAAILMEPELLGISGFVTRFPDSKKDKLHKSPSIARLEANKIIISPVGNLGIVK